MLIKRYKISEVFWKLNYVGIGNFNLNNCCKFQVSTAYKL